MALHLLGEKLDANDSPRARSIPCALVGQCKTSATPSKQPSVQIWLVLGECRRLCGAAEDRHAFFISLAQFTRESDAAFLLP